MLFGLHRCGAIVVQEAFALFAGVHVVYLVQVPWVHCVLGEGGVVDAVVLGGLVLHRIAGVSELDCPLISWLFFHFVI